MARLLSESACGLIGELQQVHSALAVVSADRLLLRCLDLEIAREQLRLGDRLLLREVESVEFVHHRRRNDDGTREATTHRVDGHLERLLVRVETAQRVQRLATKRNEVVRECEVPPAH